MHMFMADLILSSVKRVLDPLDRGGDVGQSDLHSQYLMGPLFAWKQEYFN
tara:strand:- start:94 stop:243 length:150 start_codon:yes stop_codon:yes gene_type:complete